MHNARPFALEQSFEFCSSVACPYSAWNQCETLKSRKGLDFVIAAEIRDYLVAGIPHHVALLLDDDILTTRMLIPVVYDKDLHLWWDSFPGCCGRSGLLTLSPAGSTGYCARL
jgi:hypothetical protein